MACVALIIWISSAVLNPEPPTLCMTQLATWSLRLRVSTDWPAARSPFSRFFGSVAMWLASKSRSVLPSNHCL
ncbi:hypothetical protein BC830DRAFT_1102052 [Chytriomyces sp. MP71]|nr:hypothetical protein BC830DRAFT_1102052 [Chytriomyces sp. MP71]